MDRLACVDLPALPLQLLMRRHPDWAERPAAVVDRDKPQGVLLWVNERARQAGVRAGQRYAAALALAADLRAGEISAAEIDTCVIELGERLRRFTPGVEPCTGEPGVFWLDASGLGHLYPSLAVWAQAIDEDLRSVALRSGIVVGFTRFGSYAVARACPGRRVVFDSALREQAVVTRRVPLDRIGLDPEVCVALGKLGVRSAGEFLALPGNGILRRFGAAAHRVHMLGAGELWAPLQPGAAVERCERELDLDEPVSDIESLVFLIKQQLDPLLARLAARGQALAELSFTLDVERDAPRSENIRPAEPTLDAVQLLGLVHLRLDSIRLTAGVRRMVVKVAGVPASREQLKMFARKPKRDLGAAKRAIARLRAALGDRAVVRAALRDGHLPEARYSWEPLEGVGEPHPRQVSLRPLIRRIEPRPVPLPPRAAREPDGWLLRGVDHGPVTRFVGPYLLSGGWWHTEIARDYYFGELRSGALYWFYYDRKRRRWFLQGQVS